MNYIEVIGPPGIGKSTLLKNLVNIPEKKWKTYEEAIYEIVNTLQWKDLDNVKSRLLYTLHKLNKINYKSFGICNTILQALAPDTARSIQKRYEYLIEAQIQAISNIPIRISPLNKSGFLNWHVQALRRVFMLEIFGYLPTVTFAEGPLKTHHGLQYITPQEISPNTLPKAVIFCRLSIQENIERIHLRFASTGAVSTVHNHLNDEKLETLVQYSHDIVGKNIQIIRSLGIPIYELNLTNHPTEHELKELHNFLSEYSHNSPKQIIHFADL